MVKTLTSVNQKNDKKMDALTELALEARSDERALGQLLAALIERIRGMLFREIEGTQRSLSAAEVEDIVQIALIAVWQKDLLRFDPERGSFAAFTRRRVSWVYRDHLRERARQRNVSLDAALNDGMQDPVAEDADPVSVAQKTDRELTLLILPEATERALQTLDDKTASAAVIAHDVKGQTLTALAQRFGLHPSNATRARRRGLHHLKEALSRQDSRFNEAA